LQFDIIIGVLGAITQFIISAVLYHVFFALLMILVFMTFTATCTSQELEIRVGINTNTNESS
jgi:hypothetical protein